MSHKTLSLFDLAPGKLLLERYKIVKTNRTGGMATTFAVTDLESDEPCEIQVFPHAMFDKRAQSDEFLAAMKTWTRVESKHVLRTREVQALDDGTILFITDLPPGNPLHEARKDGKPVEAQRVLDIGIQLLEGLAAIHDVGLVHGDVKPHTVHVEEAKKPRALLVDGGITPALWSAKHLGDKTQLIGTPFYAPVEQFGGESPDVQSDVYNVATVLYEMVTGVMPWKGKSFLEVFQSKLEKRPPPMSTRAPNAKVPADLEAAIVGGLMADKRERYASVDAFRSALKKVAR